MPDRRTANPSARARHRRRAWLAPALAWFVLIPIAAPSLPPADSPPTSRADVPARPVEWGYRGRLGPDRWASLSPAYSACGATTTQSPIELAGDAPTSPMTIRMDYHESVLRIAHHEHVENILDDGHTIQVTVDDGSRLETARDRYALKQFHFHAPAEHAIGGRRFPLEVHFVHQSAQGRFAVVAAFYEEGGPDGDLAHLIAHLPNAPGASVARPDVAIHPARHLPSEIAAWRYIGSFTTPPCTPDVEWLVMRRARTASAAQLAAFATRLHGNTRPLQPRAARPIQRLELGRAFASPAAERP